jgi:DNA-binding IclR family transcriptional regulator
MQDNGSQRRQQTGGNVRDLVIAALEDRRYEWRTIDGLAEQTGLPSAKVQEILESLQEDLVRSSVPDDRGRSLYTTRKHYRETHGLGARILSALSDRVA